MTPALARDCRLRCAGARSCWAAQAQHSRPLRIRASRRPATTGDGSPATLICGTAPVALCAWQLWRMKPAGPHALRHDYLSRPPAYDVRHPRPADSSPRCIAPVSATSRSDRALCQTNGSQRCVGAADFAALTLQFPSPRRDQLSAACTRTRVRVLWADSPPVARRSALISVGQHSQATRRPEIQRHVPQDLDADGSPSGGMRRGRGGPMPPILSSRRGSIAASGFRHSQGTRTSFSSPHGS